MSENGTPPIDATQLSPQDQRMAQIFAMGVNAGILSAVQTPIPVEAYDEKGRLHTIHITLAQLMHNFSESLEENSAMLDINNELAEGQLEEQAPPSRRRKR